MKWEFDILYALQKIHQPVLDHIMTGLSTIGNAGIFWTEYTRQGTSSAPCQAI